MEGLLNLIDSGLYLSKITPPPGLTHQRYAVQTLDPPEKNRNTIRICRPLSNKLNKPETWLRPSHFWQSKLMIVKHVMHHKKNHANGAEFLVIDRQVDIKYNAVDPVVLTNE